MMLGIAHDAQSRFFRLIGQLRYQLLERHFGYTFRIGLIATTILLSFLTAFLITSRGSIGLVIVGGVAGVLAFVFVYHYIAPAIVLLIITTTVAEIPLPNDMTITLMVLTLFTVVWLIKLLLVERSFKSLRPTALNYLVPVWAVAVIISLLWSSYYAEPTVRVVQTYKLIPRVATALVMILSPVALLLFANFLRSIETIKKIVWYYLAFGAFVIVATLLNVRLPPNINVEGPIGNWVCVFALGQIFFNQNLSKRLRLLLVAVLAAWLYRLTGVQANWMSGWVPTLFGCVIVVMLRSKGMFIAVVIAGLVFAAVRSDKISAVFAVNQADSANTRLVAAERIAEITGNHFLFGTGPASYKYYMWQYNDVYILQLSHNTYVDMLAETGVFGFTIYLLIWAVIGWSVLKSFLSIPKRGFEGGLVISLAAMYPMSLLLGMLGDWIIPYTYTQTLAGIRYTIWPWLWMGMAIALRAIVQQKSDESAAQSVS